MGYTSHYNYGSPDPTRKISLLSQTSDYLISFKQFFYTKITQIFGSLRNMEARSSRSFDSDNTKSSNGKGRKGKGLKKRRTTSEEDRLFNSELNEDSSLTMIKTKTTRNNTQVESLTGNIGQSTSNVPFPVPKNPVQNSTMSLSKESYDYSCDNPRFGKRSESKMTNKTALTLKSMPVIMDSNMSVATTKSTTKKPIRSPLPPGFD